MHEASRNDPCPCGGGRRYKRCCLGLTVPAAAAFTADERRTAPGRLFRFARRAGLEEARARALAAFRTGWAARGRDDEVREAMALEEREAACLGWFVGGEGAAPPVRHRGP